MLSGCFRSLSAWRWWLVFGSKTNGVGKGQLWSNSPHRRRPQAEAGQIKDVL